MHRVIPLVTAPLAQIKGGHLVTTSLAIASAFGRRHDNVLQKIDSLTRDPSIGGLEIKETYYVDESSRQQRMIQLTERAALIAMPFIGGRRSREGQRVLVDAFIALRDRQTLEWKSSRKLAAIGYTIMSDTLMMTRDDLGKATLSHHYSNEARLVNAVMFSSPQNVNRDHLDTGSLKQLETLEIRNSVLIAQGKTYQDRKVLLKDYMALLRAKATTTSALQYAASNFLRSPVASSPATESKTAANRADAGVRI